MILGVLMLASVLNCVGVDHDVIYHADACLDYNYSPVIMYL
jgi:hypothetical protein